MENCVKAIRKAKFVQQQGRCFYCCQPMWEVHSDRFAVVYGISISQADCLRATAEHLVARQDGGTNTTHNIVAACRFCNGTRHKAKSAKSPMDYRQMVRKRLRKGKWHRLMLTPIANNLG